MNKINTIEELSNSYNVQDLWDSFNIEEPIKRVLYMQTGVKYKLRFLGPFFKARRTYLPENPHLQSVMSIDELKSIVSGNANIYSKVINRLKEEQKKSPKTVTKRQRLLTADESDYDYDRAIAQSFANPPRNNPSRNRSPIPFYQTQRDINPYGDAQEILKKLYESSKWQRCVMVNALVKSGENNQPEGFKLVVLTNGMTINTRHVRNETNPTSSDIISGLFAKDITFKKEGQALNTQYEMKVARTPTLLNQSEIDSVFSKGLVDILEVIKDINRRSAAQMSSYFYKKSSSYKMPDEMYSTLFKELSHIDTMKGIDDAGDKLGNLPDEAFENKGKMSDPINCLELDL